MITLSTMSEPGETLSRGHGVMSSQNAGKSLQLHLFSG